MCMTPRANAGAMLASGRRNADRFHGELFAIYVHQENLTDDDRSALARNVTLARAQQAARRDAGREGSGRHHPSTTRASAASRSCFVGHNLRRTLARAPHRHRRSTGSSATPKAWTSACFPSDRDGRGERARPSQGVSGYAAGVGKTYQMLTEARELKQRGIDVVVGYFEPHAPQRHDRARRRARDRAAPRGRLPRDALRGNGHRRHSRAAIRPSRSSTSFRTRTCPARRAPSAGKTCTSCSTPASTC